MSIRVIFEITVIVVISCLIGLLLGVYFSHIRNRVKLKSAGNSESNSASIDNVNEEKMSKITVEWAEQLQILYAQIDLICELSPAFTVCYDYTRECFSISENGQNQLGLQEHTGQKDFEDLIHPDDIFIYEEVTEAENVRKAELAESPYILKLRQKDTQEYSEYLTRLKPVYDENGISAALVIAFINTDYLKKT